MNLLEIKQYFQQVKIASLTSICAYFNCDSELVRSMMSHWQRKGCLRKFTQAPNCGTCTQCLPKPTEIYEWVG